MPPRLSVLATSQDVIGWQNFTEGRITHHLYCVQSDHLRQLDSSRDSLSWAGGLVNQLLMLVHAQWVFRNGLVHQRESYGLKSAEQQTLHQEMELEYARGTVRLDPKDHFLVQEPFSVLWAQLRSDKQIWLRAVRIAHGDTGSNPTMATSSTPPGPCRSPQVAVSQVGVIIISSATAPSSRSAQRHSAPTLPARRPQRLRLQQSGSSTGEYWSLKWKRTQSSWQEDNEPLVSWGRPPGLPMLAAESHSQPHWCLR